MKKVFKAMQAATHGQEQEFAAKYAATRSTAPTFRVVYVDWLAEGISRNLDPFRSETAKTYKSQIETHVLPVLGDLPIDVVGNKAVNQVVQAMVKAGKSPATIALNVGLIKDIRGFLRGENGPIYPVQWDSKAIDAPAVNKRLQKTPKANAQTLTAALKCTAGVSDHTQALLALLAGSGLRIQEALAITTQDTGRNTVWLPDESKIIVRQQRDGIVLGPVKTEAGNREVDLSDKLNNWLQFAMAPVNDINGLVFPESESFYRREIEKCGVKGGFHSIRRFRVTHIRMNGVPEPLVKFWIGHEDPSVTGRYTEVLSEIVARKAQANQVGLGFELPEAL
jgi:integrase